MRRQAIAQLDQITPGKAAKFEFERDGIQYEGFVARYNNELIAYENVCRHLPVSLDYDDSQFFSKDGKHIICQTHGALYEPRTGLCVSGPCQGAKLKPLQIEVDQKNVWLLLQEDEE